MSNPFGWAYLGQGYAGPQAHSRTVADIATPTEALLKATGLGKADSASPTEALSKAPGLSKATSAALTDALVRAVGLGRTDSVDSSEVLVRSVSGAFGISFTTAVPVSEAPVFSAVLMRALEDSVDPTESLAFSLAMVLTEVLATTELPITSLLHTSWPPSTDDTWEDSTEVRWPELVESRW
jgi:hypothetical protein